MKKIFPSLLTAALLGSLVLPVLSGCGNKPLYGTFELPALPEGVVDIYLDANGSWSSDGEHFNYELTPSNGGTDDDVHLEIFVEPKYRVKEVKLLVEAEDGSWSQEMTELEEGYKFFKERTLENGNTAECVNYRTKSMPTFQGKKGTAKVTVPVLTLEEAEYNLHLEKIWEEEGGVVLDKTALQPYLDELTFEVTKKGATSSYNLEEFEENILGKDELYQYGETFKVKISYPAGTMLGDRSGGPNVAFLYIEADADTGENILDGGWLDRKQLDGGMQLGAGVFLERNNYVSFTCDLNNCTAEWEFKVMRGSKICFNEFELFVLLHNSLPFSD